MHLGAWTGAGSSLWCWTPRVGARAGREGGDGGSGGGSAVPEAGRARGPTGCGAGGDPRAHRRRWAAAIADHDESGCWLRKRGLLDKSVDTKSGQKGIRGSRGYICTKKKVSLHYKRKHLCTIKESIFDTFYGGLIKLLAGCPGNIQATSLLASKK